MRSGEVTMGSVAFTLMLITVISKFSGMLREMLFSGLFGTTAIKDIYVISESIVALSFSFLFLSVQSTFIPMYNQIRSEEGRKNADRFTSNLIFTLLALSTVIILLFIIFMRPIVSLVASGFTGEKFEQTVFFTRIAVVQIWFSAVNGPLIGYLNIYDNFNTPATTGIIMNVFLVIFAYLSYLTNSLLVLAIGNVIAHGIQYIFFPPAMRKTGFRSELIFHPFNPHIKKYMGIAVPAMFSILVNDLSIIIDKTIATTVAVHGGVSALDYANKIFMLAQGVIIVSIVTASYPRLSALAQQPDKRPMKRMIASSLISGLILIIPATVGLMIFVQPVVRLFYQRGAFTAESTLLTSGALFWYAPGLISLMFYQLLVPVFYSLHDTKTPLVVSVIQVASDISLNFLLSSLFGLNGLAMSTMIGNTLGALLLLLLLHKKLGKMHYSEITVTTIKIVLATVVMAWISHKLFIALSGGMRESFALLISVIFAVIVYGILILFSRIPVVKNHINRFYHKKHHRI